MCVLLQCNVQEQNVQQVCIFWRGYMSFNRYLYVLPRSIGIWNVEMWHWVVQLPNVSKNIGGYLHFKVILESTTLLYSLIFDKTWTPSYFRFSLSSKNKQNKEATTWKTRHRRISSTFILPHHQALTKFSTATIAKEGNKANSLASKNIVYMNNRVTR